MTTKYPDCELIGDLNDDCDADLTDFAIISVYWLESDCGAPNWCDGTDVDFSTIVDNADLDQFIAKWFIGSGPA